MQPLHLEMLTASIPPVFRLRIDGLAAVSSENADTVSEFPSPPFF
jgi:hypothetical protein